MGRTGFFIEDILKLPDNNSKQRFDQGRAFLSDQANRELFWSEYKKHSIASDQSLLWWKIYWNNFSQYYLKLSSEGVIHKVDIKKTSAKYEQRQYLNKIKKIGGKDSEKHQNIDLKCKETQASADDASKYPSDSPLFKLEKLTSVKFLLTNSDICPIKTLLEKKVPSHSRRRKSRTAFTAQQLSELEKVFRKQKYLTPSDRDRIASNLNLSSAQVITWFQNRRAKYKRDIEEMHNDLLYARKLKLKKSDCTNEKKTNETKDGVKK